jgi:hypothetical protein
MRPHPAQSDLLLRSAHADWNGARWEQLPNDGYRYEVIAGVLYRSSTRARFTI